MWFPVPLVHRASDIHCGLVQAGFVMHLGQVSHLITTVFDDECSLILHYRSFQPVWCGWCPNLWGWHHTPSRQALSIFQTRYYWVNNDQSITTINTTLLYYNPGVAIDCIPVFFGPVIKVNLDDFPKKLALDVRTNIPLKCIGSESAIVFVE